MKQINDFMHCIKCLDDIPSGLSAQEYQQIEVGLTRNGLQVWCRRHDCNIYNVDFEGQDHPTNISAPKKTASLCDMDIEAFLNLREWVESALQAQGAKITDTGMGFGVADIGISIDGMPFSIQLKPRPLATGDYSGLP